MARQMPMVWNVASRVLVVLVVLLLLEGAWCQILIKVRTTEGSMVTSSYSIRKWSSANLAENLQRFIEHEEIRLKVISNSSAHEDEVPFVERRLAEFKVIYADYVKNVSDTKFKDSLNQFHPTTIFAAIRNFLATWEEKLANQTIYGKRLREFLEYNDVKPLPTRHDLEKIGTAITVVQAAFNLSMADLLQGLVRDIQGEPLSRADCYDIGRKTVLKAGLIDTALEWLEMSVSTIDLEKIDASQLTFNLSDALAALARIAYRKKDNEKAIRLYEKAVEIDPENPGVYQGYVKHRFGRNVELLTVLDREKVEPWRKKFFDRCANVSNSDWREEEKKLLKPNLRCRLRKSANVPYQFYREEILSTIPFVSVLYNFLSAREVTVLRNRTLDQLKEKVLPGNSPNTMWGYKTSYFYDDHDEIVRRVSQRASDVTAINASQSKTSYSLGEPLHVIDYGISGLALPHAEAQRKYTATYMGIIRGSRLATVQVFLSDALLGGETVFVDLNITITPVKGLAVLWQNYKPNGEAEQNLFPATCPLAVGENIVIEKGLWRLGNDRHALCGRKRKTSHLTLESA
ncbi:unnamed protein product [Lymnaea stagnalis]|uniref:Prolyl 4-hydroxylase alpha subunit domain-containing protein n=1 Tax=Lymnaea stagnalis TaxID=6523 RepID=A0AAV2HK51_LYMST